MLKMNFGKILNVSDIETLRKILKGYNGIITKEIYDYLESLIGLETSVFSSEITDDVKTKLLDIKLYRQIAIYNIYNIVKNALEKESKYGELTVRGNESRFEGLSALIKIGNEEQRIFDYEYSSMELPTKKEFLVHDKYIIDSIGLLTFYLMEITKEKEENIKLYKNLLEEDKNSLYPKDIVIDETSGEEIPIFGGRGSREILNQEHNIITTNTLLKVLEAKLKRGDFDKMIEAKKYYYEVLLKALDINSDDFEESKKRIFGNGEQCNVKVLTKSYPGINVHTNITTF